MKHQYVRRSFLFEILLIMIGLSTACDKTKTEQSKNISGTLHFALSGSSSSGVTYRLSNAVFHIAGQSNIDLSADDNIRIDSIDTVLTVGHYTVELSSEWVIYRVDQDGGLAVVKAAMESANPQNFDINDGETTNISYRFRVGDEIIRFGEGQLKISVGMDESEIKVSFQKGPNMAVPRMNHSVIKLDDESIMVIGGHGTGFTSLNTAEIWNSTTDAFTSLTLNSPRDYFAMQKLADNKYLIAGGAYDLGVAPGYTTAEIFDPATLTFRPVADMVRPHMVFSGTLLRDGRALLVGGWYDNNSASYGEIYHPDTVAFSSTGPLNYPRSQPVVLPTSNGGAVVLCGTNMYGQDTRPPIEVYDATTNLFSVLRSELIPDSPGWSVSLSSNPRAYETRLNDGRYLLVATNANAIEKTILLAFDPFTLKFNKIGGFNELGSGQLIWDDANQIAYVTPFNLNNTVGMVKFDLLLNNAKFYPIEGFQISYYLGYPGIVRLIDSNRIMYTGGFSCSNTNFCPVPDTFFAKISAAP